MTGSVGTPLRQRAEYTYRFNAKTGRHGWLRLTPAYSVKIVEELMDRYQEPRRILDPFCGTATTAVSAAYRGHEGITTDVNPFLVWLGQAKITEYRESSIRSTGSACNRVGESIDRGLVEPVIPPRIHNIERWWSADVLEFLCTLKATIDVETGKDSIERTLLSVAFCRTLIKLSKAAFNHQSMSFKDDGQLELALAIDMVHVFTDDVQFVLTGARDNPLGSGSVVYGDARRLEDVVDGGFDLVITSPPYANRMSYIRELRPYLYWLGFIESGREAGELDWTSIGGTWGVATSRLSDWSRTGRGFESRLLDEVLARIASSSHKSGTILASYVAKYCDDMWEHFQSLVKVLNSGCEVHYIVGNSTFYGVLLPTERIYAMMLERLGFEKIRCTAIRKRNSKKELVEFDVRARWTGGNSEL